MPITTVIVPTFNRVHLFRETLAAALNQARPPSEVIVVDDGSTDSTLDGSAGGEAPEFVRNARAASKRARIRFIHRMAPLPNLGGIMAAKYFLFVG